MQLHLFDLIGKREITKKMLPASFIIFLIVFGENFIIPIFSIFVNGITNNLLYTGIVLSLIGFVGIFISIPIGIIADKFNVKRLLLLSVGSFIFIPILYVTFQNIVALFLIRTLSAVMSTIIWCSIWTYVFGKVDKGHTAHEISTVSKAIRLASSISPVLGGIVAIVSFILPFYIISLVFLFALFVLLVLLRDQY